VWILADHGFFVAFLRHKSRARGIQAFHKTVTWRIPRDSAVKADAISVIRLPFLGATQQKIQAVLDVAKR
jgi:hypothetical protein